VRPDDLPLTLVASFGLVLALVAAGYVGWRLGREQGICEVGCAEATAGAGTGDYYGGLCRCTIDGVEVTLP
jgi:hypothetical protein